MITRALANLAITSLAGLCCSAASAADLSGVSGWAGKYPYDKIVGGKSLWDQKNVQDAMRAAMGERYFALARKTLLAGPQSPVSGNAKGSFVAWSCKAHDCGDNQISVFLNSVTGTAQACMRVSDRSGQVQDLWLAEGKSRPLGKDACLSTGSDPFVLLESFGVKH